MLRAGGGRGGDLYRMGNGLLIFARANCDANRLFHGALLSTANYLLIVISAEVFKALDRRDGGGRLALCLALLGKWCMGLGATVAAVLLLAG